MSACPAALRHGSPRSPGPGASAATLACISWASATLSVLALCTANAPVRTAQGRTELVGEGAAVRPGDPHGGVEAVREQGRRLVDDELTL